MSAIANLTIDQGATFSSNVNVKNSDGTSFDLTGHTVAAKMALGFSSTRTRTVITSSVSNATEGEISLTLTATQTNALEAPARYVYDVEVTSTADGNVTRVIEGIISTRPSVTT